MNMERMRAVQGDITQQPVGAIVNAANSSLLGGGGVDGAIHRAAGPQLLEECRSLHGCKTGEAKITRGYKLLAKHVIHTVGPIWSLVGGGVREDSLLENCYRNSLTLAVDHDVKTIAFPAISTGVYRFPPRRAAEIAIRTTRTFLAQINSIEQVSFVCFDAPTYRLYIELLSTMGTKNS